MADSTPATIRPSLLQWIADAAARQDISDFQLAAHLGQLDYLEDRDLDLYHSLVGQLFDMIRASVDDGDAWATVGNALLSLAQRLQGPLQADARFFAATAFQSGGYSAAAYLSLRDTDPKQWQNDTYRACQDLLTRPSHVTSQLVQRLVSAVRDGDLSQIRSAVEAAQHAAKTALGEGPEEWIAARTYEVILKRFEKSNIRSLLPDGESKMWDPLVCSMLDRRPPIWEFFPSQVDAIQAGLLSSTETYSLQMPTGAGKTALTETLLFSHLTTSPDNMAVLLVPFRALARELRGSLGQRLSDDLNLPTRAVYGGTVPTPEEATDLQSTRAIIATPEALTGLLGAHPEVFRRISLVICDEGHLLDAPGRGVSLELLLARFRGRKPQPQIVFLSAIVPNIDEINAWLGGSKQSVVRSTFRPAIAEFAVMRPQTAPGKKTVSSVTLQLMRWDGATVSHEINDFLTRQDFQFTNAQTGRANTYKLDSVKAQTVAAALKALSLGSVAVFAATKTGKQGVLGLAEELLTQIKAGVAPPNLSRFVRDENRLSDAVDYLSREYDANWGGTRALKAGVVVHHGDLPQETREVLEELFEGEVAPMVICTSTLAEGVNMPIRTLVLYSVQFSDKQGQRKPMLARDIKNLVGRAGRAGSSTRGLVICANPNQWVDVRPVAVGEPGETVTGGLYKLIASLREFLAKEGRLSAGAIAIDGDFLGRQPVLFSLIDGIDATLVELLSDDMGKDEFLGLAESLVSDTFAVERADPDEERVLRRVFSLRADQIHDLRTSGRLAWVRQTGAMPRMVAPVLDILASTLPSLDQVKSVLDPVLLDPVLRWALGRPEFIRDTKEAYRSDDAPSPEGIRALVLPWLQGKTYGRIAQAANLKIDDCLRIHTKVVAYSLVTLVEQAIALLQCQAEQAGKPVAEAVAILPDCLRYGVPSRVARDLMAGGVRHRQPAILLAEEVERSLGDNSLEHPPTRHAKAAAELLASDPDKWEDKLGPLQYRRTRHDLRSHM